MDKSKIYFGGIIQQRIGNGLHLDGKGKGWNKKMTSGFLFWEAGKRTVLSKLGRTGGGTVRVGIKSRIYVWMYEV